MNKEEYPIEEELEEFMQLSNKLMQENKEFQARIDKAIEYIQDKERDVIEWEYKSSFYSVKNELLKILKGENND